MRDACTVGRRIDSSETEGDLGATEKLNGGDSRDGPQVRVGDFWWFGREGRGGGGRGEGEEGGERGRRGSGFSDGEGVWGGGGGDLWTER